MIQDLETERKLLSSLLSNDNEAINRCRNRITSECFTDTTHILMWRAIENVDREGGELDHWHVFQWLVKHPQPDIGIQLQLTDILQFDGYNPSSSLYAERLLELSARRKLATLGMRFLQASQSETEDIDDVLTECKDGIDAIINSQADDTLTLRQSIGTVSNIIRENAMGNKRVGTLTGFSLFDRNGGFHNGDLIIFAGDTSMGKSSLALSVALNQITMDAPIAFYSMEMQHYQLTSRLLSMLSGVTSSSILYKQLSAYDQDKVQRSIAGIQDKRLFYDDKSTSSLDHILSSIRSLRNRFRIQGAYIDYLQIIDLGGTSRMSKEEQTANAARKLKNLAKDLGIWIVALSQLSRKKETEAPFPTKDRLRGSGQIAEAADTVVLLYRPEYYNIHSFPKPYNNEYDPDIVHNKAMLNMCKRRNTGTGVCVCNFIPELTLYTEKDVSQLPSVQGGGQDNPLPFVPTAADKDLYGDDIPFRAGAYIASSTHNHRPAMYTARQLKDRERYLRNREQRLEGARQWRESHPGYHAEWVKRR